MDIVSLVILIFETIFFLIYSVWILAQIVGRAKNASSQDKKMLNIGRAFTLGGLMGITFAKRSGQDFAFSFPLIELFLFLFIIGARYYALSFRVKEENTNTFHYAFDQLLEKMYRRYLEPLWK